MKRKDSRRRIRIFYGILIIPTLLWAVLSLVGAAKILDFDTGEKRNKHVMAEDTNLSNVTAELETYYDDRVPFRSILLNMNSTLNWIVELPYTKVVEPVLIRWANVSLDKKNAGTSNQVAEGAEDAVPVPEGEAVPGGATVPGGEAVSDGAAFSDGEAVPDSEVVPGEGAGVGEVPGDEVPAEETPAVLPILPPYYESPIEAGYYPFKEVGEGVIQGRDGWLFTMESYNDYTGANYPSEEQLAQKMAYMELLNQLCQNKGIQLHIAAMPNKNTVYPEYMPTLDQAPVSAVNVLEEYMHANSSVDFQYLDDAILGAKAYGQLYYKLDTHWNNRGGLAAYLYLRNTLGLPPIDMADIGSVDMDPYFGDLATYSGLPSASFDPDNAVMMNYKLEVPQQLIQGENDYIDELVCPNAECPLTLVMVGDSYRHSLLPYLSRDFAHVYSLSETKLDSSMIDILNSADIILLEGVERNFFFMSYFDSTIVQLIEMMS